MSTLTRQSNRKPQSLRECRTFGDLMQLREPRNIGGVCKRCGAWGVEGWHYSVRASICCTCAEKAKNEVLPGVVASERKARHWVKKKLGGDDVRFIANLSGASVEFVQEEIRRRDAKAVQS